MARDCPSCARVVERLARAQETLLQHQRALELCSTELLPLKYERHTTPPAVQASVAASATSRHSLHSHYSANSATSAAPHGAAEPSPPSAMLSTWQTFADGLDKELTRISTGPRGQGRSRQIAGDMLRTPRVSYNTPMRQSLPQSGAVAGNTADDARRPSFSTVGSTSLPEYKNSAAPFSIDYSAAVRSTLAKIGPRRHSQVWTNGTIRQETAPDVASKWFGRSSLPSWQVTYVLHLLTFVVVAADMMVVALQAGKATVSQEEIYATAVFTLWYLVELLLRISTQRWLFFKATGFEGVLNRLDIVITVSAILDSIRLSVTMDSSLFGTLVKLFRLLRVFRLLCHIRDMKKLFYSMVSSAMTLIWSLVSLFLLIFVFAVFFTQSVVQYLEREDHPDDTDIMHMQQRLQEDFGGVYQSMLSLFMAITSGRSWGDFSTVLAETHPVAEATFIVYMCLALVGILNVVTAVFVESAMRASKNYKELMLQEKQIMDRMNVRHMKKIFKSIDTNCSGTVSMEELEKFIADEELGLQMYFQALDISARDTQSLFLLLDSDESGEVDIDEFCDGCMRLGGHATSFDLNSLLYEQRRTNQYLVQSSKVCFQQMEWLRQRLESIERCGRVGMPQAQACLVSDFPSFPRQDSPTSTSAQQHRTSRGSVDMVADPTKHTDHSSYASFPSSCLDQTSKLISEHAVPHSPCGSSASAHGTLRGGMVEFPDAPTSFSCQIGALLESLPHDDRVSKAVTRTKHDFGVGSTIIEGDAEDSPTPSKNSVRL